jgi:hypothetical protein
MPARDALHYQMIFQDELIPGGILGRMLDGFERAQRGMGLATGRESPIEAAPNKIGLFHDAVPYDESEDGMRKYFARHMELTLAFYLDPRMSALVTAAAESMPVDTVLRPEDLPATHGFLLLPGGLAEIDIRGQLMVHNVVAWFQRAGGVDIWYMSNKYDERDMVNMRQRRMFGGNYEGLPTLSPAVYTRVEFGQGVPLGLGSTKVVPPEVTESMHVEVDPVSGQVAAMWGVGYDLNEWFGDAMKVEPNASVAWMFATWRLMQQTITDVRTEPVDRALRRRAQKRNMKRDDVTVIALRKRKRVDGEVETDIEWSHRWLRRGHWRQQWVGPRNGELGVERYQTPIWIHPTICGPEDAPLLVRDHVYSLER